MVRSSCEDKEASWGYNDGETVPSLERHPSQEEHHHLGSRVFRLSCSHSRKRDGTVVQREHGECMPPLFLLPIYELVSPPVA